MLESVFRAAISYTEWGWSVLPAGADKRPLGKWKASQQGAVSRECIARWFQQSPPAVAVVTGWAASRLVVLDVDPRHGGLDSLGTLVQEYGELPLTPTAHTGGGGTHYYFYLPQPTRSAKAIRPGLDVQADGSLVIAPPSMHPSGGRYVWLISPNEQALAPVPTWLLNLSRHARHSPASIADKRDTVFGPGQRNAGLTRLAGTLRRCGVPQVELTLCLQVLNLGMCFPPLEVSEVDAIAASVGRYASSPTFQMSARSIIEAYKQQQA